MTHLETLQDVFKNRAFVIPDYQRAYAWLEEHRVDLLNDLEDLERLPTLKMHYTGTLVLHRGRHPKRVVRGQQYQIFDVVDGQQRLTTLIILLNCISRRLRQTGVTAAIEVAANYEDEYVRRKAVQEELYKLKLNDEDGTHGFFVDYIINDLPFPDLTAAGRRNLINAKVEFETYLARLCDGSMITDGRRDRLEALAQRITTRLGFVVYEVESEAEVGVMFEAMNARGRPLTQMEKVKNLLLYLSGKFSGSEEALNTIVAEIRHTWKDVLEAVVAADPDGDEDQFLRYHWAIYPGARWFDDDRRDKARDIHKAVKKTFVLGNDRSRDDLYQELRAYLESLRSVVKSYRDTLNPKYALAFSGIGNRKSELMGLGTSLLRLGRLSAIAPLLIASHHKFGNDPASLSEIWRLAEVLAFRLVALERYANTGRSRVYRLAYEVMANKRAALETIAQMKTLIEDYGPDVAVRTRLADQTRNFYAWAGIRYFLYEYERKLVEEAHQKFTVDWEAFYKHKPKDDTVEHILPQGENTLQKKYWEDRFTEEAFRSCRHRLGNLCLTDWNSHYGNKGFDEKKGSESADKDEKVYRNSRWRTELELVAYQEWTENEIQQRHSCLVEFALQRWRI